MSKDFYGGEDTEIPSISNYMRWEDEDNTFRILGAFSDGTAIQGMEYWKTNEKNKRVPIRYGKKEDGTYPSVAISELEENKFGDLDIPKYFWAVPVWNYAEKRVQILEITQKSIIKGIKAYIANSKWGDPREYDIIVNKGKEGEKTVYTVTVNPKEKLDKSIIEQYTNSNINIKALFKGEDPFSAEGKDESEVKNGDIFAQAN